MTGPLTIAFAGTPRFAVPTLEALISSGLDVRLVITQPDRPSGRGLELGASPIKQSALGHGIPVTQPDKIKNDEPFRAQLETLHLAASIVVGYGRIIPQWMIDLPRFGNLNLHASLLPKYRGAAPIQWAIARGETITGVTTMRIDAGLDTGDVLLRSELPIAPDDTAESIAPKLAEMGAQLMVETLRGIQVGTVQPRPQDHSQATFAPILKKEDGKVDFRRSAVEIWNRLRGFLPWPGAYTRYRGKTFHIWQATPLAARLPSAELKVEDGLVFVGCGDSSSLELLEVQVEGRKRMSSQNFVNGYRPNTGEKMGD